LFKIIEMKISFWRIFWPSFIAVIFASIIGTLSFFGVIGGVLAVFSSEKVEESSNNSVLRMTLKGDIFENSETEFDPYNLRLNQKIGLSDLLYGIQKAKSDKSIKGLYLEIDGINAGYSTIKELRKALNDFKSSGKFIVAYHMGELISLKQLYLTSITKDNYAFPTSHVEFLGLGRQYDFYVNTLSKIGVEMQVVRGKENHFKSAVEPYINTKLSDSARLQVEVVYRKLWSEILNDISQNTSLDLNKMNEIAENALVTTSKDAAKYKLIHGVKYKDEIESILKSKIDLAQNDKLEFSEFEKYAKNNFYESQELTSVKNPSIAVILAEGEISTNGDGLSSDKIAKYIKEARLDKNIKVIVLRVNSPGGSALASDIIWREVVIAKKTKKVIVSMGDYAASGGYYISCAADRIFAEPTTITGSIGVFGVIPFTGRLFEEKLGISFDEVKTNKHAVLSLNRKLTPEEIAVIQNDVEEIYDDFLSRVSEGRKLTKNKVHQIARGRVWMGSDALKIGLVDELGGLNEAILYAKKMVKSKDQTIKYWPEKKVQPFDKLMEDFGELKNNSSLKVTHKELPKVVVEYLNTIQSLENFGGIQMRLPHIYHIQ
jgi:protease-4